MKVLPKVPNKLILLSFLIFILPVLFLTSNFVAFAQDQEMKQPALSGGELFLKNRCVNCHTVGRGRFVGPDLANVESRYSKDEIKQWMENAQSIYQAKGKMPVNEGYPPMPPLNVSSYEADLIADYLLNLKMESLPKAKSGTIGGSIANKSNEQEAAKDVELTLTAYMGDKSTDEKTTKTDDKGSFAFTGLTWDRAYTLSLNYKGAEYVTDKMVFAPEETTKTLNLPIYEPTEDDKDISINAGHMIVQISDKQFTVAEIMIFHNGSNQIFVGKPKDHETRRTLKFDVPKNISDLELLEGLRDDIVVKEGQSFFDTSAFSPGVKRIVYAYKLPFKSGKNIIEKKLNYPVEKFVLLVSDSETNVKVDGLMGGETVDIDNGKFHRWTGESLMVGSAIKIEIGKPLLGEDWLKWATFVAIIVLVGGGALYSFIWASRKEEPKKETSQAAPIISTEGLEKERAGLIIEIAELDNRFEAKKISEEEYRKIRYRKKERLLEITLSLKKK